MLISSNFRSYKVCHQKVVSLVLLHLKGSSLALLVARVAAVMCWVMMLRTGDLGGALGNYLPGKHQHQLEGSSVTGRALGWSHPVSL